MVWKVKECHLSIWWIMGKLGLTNNRENGMEEKPSGKKRQEKRYPMPDRIDATPEQIARRILGGTRKEKTEPNGKDSSE